MKKEVTVERLKEVLEYCKFTGKFKWKGKRRKHKVGYMSNGYLNISIDGTRYLGHRLAWLYMTGVHPKGQIDHINHKTRNNRFHNLRDVSHLENQRNKSLAKNNTSGHTGVTRYYSKDKRKKWRAQIMVSGKCITLGYFPCKIGAVAARHKADVKYGFHPNHGW